MPNTMRWVMPWCDNFGGRRSGWTGRHNVKVICRMVLAACQLLESLPAAP